MFKSVGVAGNASAVVAGIVRFGSETNWGNEHWGAVSHLPSQRCLKWLKSRIGLAGIS